MLIVKVGGGKNINWGYISEDLTSLIKKEEVVLVHGASSRRDQVAKKLGVPTRYVNSPSGYKGVYTDKKALEILSMVYAGLVNKSIVARLQKAGINAVGLSGVDGRIWEGKRKTNILSQENGKTKLIKNTFTGKVETVNTNLINLLIDNGYLPVITQPAISSDGELINTDNDRNIAVMAGALRVKKLVVLFEAPGFLKEPSDESSLLRKISKKDLPSLMRYAKGTMKKKVLGAIEAFEHGVKTVYWSDGRIKEPIRNALAGKGTMIK
ncbi:[LysW]-aminoadipate kinase [Patescibacteria group bacterium]|nr:[LysW]-aminoadipate kinase [Patescibacteria group bacterium]